MCAFIRLRAFSKRLKDWGQRRAASVANHLGRPLFRFETSWFSLAPGLLSSFVLRGFGSFLVEQGADGVVEVGRLEQPGVAPEKSTEGYGSCRLPPRRAVEALPDGTALPVDEELFKVPRYVGPLDRLPDDELGVAHEAHLVVGRPRQAGLQPGEHLVLALAVGRDLKRKRRRTKEGFSSSKVNGSTHLFEEDGLGHEAAAGAHVL